MPAEHAPEYGGEPGSERPAAGEASLFDLLNYARPEEIADLVDAIDKFESGQWSAEQFRKFRLTRGTYGQRQSDASMERVKIPQGILTAQQLDALGEVAVRYSRGFGHITTR